MIRLMVALLLSALAACAEYREPRANCFNLIAATGDEDPCEFFELGGPDGSLVTDV